HRFDGLQRCCLHLILPAVFEGLQVELHDEAVAFFVLYLFIEPVTGLLAQPFFIDHLLDIGGQPKYARCFITLGVFCQSVGHIHQRIQPHYVGGTEGGRLGVSHCRTGKFIDFSYRETQPVYQMGERQHGVHTDAVANKGRRILTQDRGFAEELIAVVHQEIDHFRLGAGRWNDFEQPQVTGWVKEVRTAEMGFKVVAPPFGHEVYGNARRIGGHERADFAVLFYLAEHLFFDIQPFDHHFNNPIGRRNRRHVVIEITGGNELGVIRAEYRRRIGFEGRLERLVYDAVTHHFTIERQTFACFLYRQFAGDDVEQQYLYANIGKVARNSRPHYARTQNSYFLNSSHI